MDLNDSVNAQRAAQPCCNLTGDELRDAKRRALAALEAAMRRPELSPILIPDAAGASSSTPDSETPQPAVA